MKGEAALTHQKIPSHKAITTSGEPFFLCGVRKIKLCHRGASNIRSSSNFQPIMLLSTNEYSLKGLKYIIFVTIQHVGLLLITTLFIWNYMLRTLVTWAVGWTWLAWARALILPRKFSVDGAATISLKGQIKMTWDEREYEVGGFWCRQMALVLHGK